MIQIKENKKGYEFGVILATDYYPKQDPQGGGGEGAVAKSPETRTFTTKMFDCMIVEVGGVQRPE